MAPLKADSEAMFEHHTPDRWKTMKLSAFTQPMIVARHKAITNGESTRRGGSRRANTWLSLMSRLFTLGMPDHVQANPVEGIKRNEEVERERFLSEIELTTLWRYLEGHAKTEAAVAVQFILLTGCRPGEAFQAKWTEIDLATGRWVKPATRTKQRKRHVVALTDMALRVLKRLETHKRSEYVFPAPGDASQPRRDQLKAFWRAATSVLTAFSLLAARLAGFCRRVPLLSGLAVLRPHGCGRCLRYCWHRHRGQYASQYRRRCEFPHFVDLHQVCCRRWNCLSNVCGKREPLDPFLSRLIFICRLAQDFQGASSSLDPIGNSLRRATSVDNV